MRDGALCKPKALKPGDRVAVVAPASPFPRDEFEAGLEEVRRLGFEPVVDQSVFSRRRYLAGEAADRAHALMAAWADPAIGAVLTARGGYGSVQLIPYLDEVFIRATPKILVGYSDVTALLSFLTTRCGVTAVHGPTVTGRLGRGEASYDRASLLRALCDPAPGGPLWAPSLEAVVPGEAAGPIFGGNLTQLVSSLGTPWAFDPPDGCVLFLEDVNERPYRLDRMLTHLDQAGVLGRASALVFGEMPGCDEADGAITAREVCGEIAGRHGRPALWGLPSGHTSGPAVTLPLGVAVRVVSAAGAAAMVVEDSAVR
jgi:muramoyltetrapeptide carboxypeptidase